MKKLYKVVTSILLAVSLILAALILLPKIFGIETLAVLSGSMEPTYHVGSLLYVSKTEPEKIEVGDSITFKLSEDMVVTHRVVEKNEEEQYFKTKGDANDNVDGGEVKYSNVIEKALFSIPLLGYAAVYVGTKSGRIILITVILAILMLTFLPELLMKDEKDGGAK